MILSFRILQVLCLSGVLVWQTGAVCMDKVRTCNRVSGRCQDARIGATIRSNCPATCGVCTPDVEVCADNPNCMNWNRNGFCASGMASTELKKKLCPRTCGFGCPGSSGSGTGGSGGSGGSDKKYQVFADSMDESADPCNDFYKFTCGKYISQHKPMKPLDQFSTFIGLMGDIARKRMDLLFNNDATNSPAVTKMRTYRDICMGTSKIEHDRATQLYAELGRIKCPMLDQNWNARNDFNIDNMIIEMSKITGTNFVFTVDLAMDPETKRPISTYAPPKVIAPNINIYDGSDPSRKQAFHDFLSEIFGIIGGDGNSQKSLGAIGADIEEVIKLDEKIAGILMSNNFKGGLEDAVAWEKTDYNTLVLISNANNLNNLINGDDRMTRPLREYFTTTNPPVLINTRPVLTAVNDEYKKYLPTTAGGAPLQPTKNLANYFCTRFIMTQIPYLDSRFTRAFDRLAETIDGTPPKSTRQQECLDIVTNAFPAVLDTLFVKKYLPDSTVRGMTKMVDELKSGLSDMFMKDSWMSPEVRKIAQKKLQKTKALIGSIQGVMDLASLDKLYGDGLNIPNSLRDATLAINNHLAPAGLSALVDPNVPLPPKTLRNILGVRRLFYLRLGPPRSVRKVLNQLRQTQP